MVIKIEKLPIESLELGEGPLWHPENEALYFVNTPHGEIHRYVPATKKHTKAVVGNYVSIVIPVEGQKDTFVAAVGNEIGLIKWDGESDEVSIIKKITQLGNEPKNKMNLFNDGKCDPSGRLWLGTMGLDENKKIIPKNSDFYSVEGTKLKKHLTDISISNGMDWNMELKKFYYTDSCKEAVEEFNFDINKGTISNGKVIFTLKKHNIPGITDGMTIDAAGNLWVAIFNANRVIQIDPRKPETLLQSIQIPAQQVTSVAFGGANLDELYVTTAHFELEGVKISGPDEGCTFKITGTGAKGLPPCYFKNNL